VGLIGSFAGMVDAFDSTVDDLNSRYKSELASAMRYAGQAAVAKLDDDADSIAAKFKQGATPGNVRELIAAGLIPLSAAAFYPSLELTAADKTSYWRNTLGKMTSQQQIDWINAHKDELSPEAAEVLVGPPGHQHINPLVYSHPKSQNAELDPMMNAWTRFFDSRPTNLALDVTGQAEFTKYFIKPELD
jgi:hypothetical protein